MQLASEYAADEIERGIAGGSLAPGPSKIARRACPADAAGDPRRRPAPEMAAGKDEGRGWPVRIPTTLMAPATCP